MSLLTDNGKEFTDRLLYRDKQASAAANMSSINCALRL
jgi:hypothetical protein